mmetsp:Transcript_28401/g.70955  ORF Transcript_28401/g.70955 Transcript_28401/m.70955 type:complete len:257 (+) Transcript_28401:1206-1976(+)
MNSNASLYTSSALSLRYCSSAMGPMPGLEVRYEDTRLAASMVRMYRWSLNARTLLGSLIYCLSNPFFLVVTFSANLSILSPTCLFWPSHPRSATLVGTLSPIMPPLIVPPDEGCRWNCTIVATSMAVKPGNSGGVTPGIPPPKTGSSKDGPVWSGISSFKRSVSAGWRRDDVPPVRPGRSDGCCCCWGVRSASASLRMPWAAAAPPSTMPEVVAAMPPRGSTPMPMPMPPMPTPMPMPASGWVTIDSRLDAARRTR